MLRARALRREREEALHAAVVGAYAELKRELLSPGCSYTQAEKTGEELLELMLGYMQQNEITTPKVANLVGVAKLHLEKTDEALALFHGAQPLKRANGVMLRSSSPQEIGFARTVLCNRGMALSMKGDFAAAEATIREAHKLHARLDEAEDFEKGLFFHSVATVRQVRIDDSAERSCWKAFEAAASILPLHIFDIFRNNIRASNFDEIHSPWISNRFDFTWESLVRDYLARGETPPPALFNNTGCLLAQKRQAKDALGNFEVALASLEAQIPPPQLQIATVLHNCAALFRSIKSWEEGIRHATRALEIRTAILGPGAVHVVSTQLLLAGLLDRAGEKEASIALLSDALCRFDAPAEPYLPTMLYAAGRRAKRRLARLQGAS